jgi:uncharacterized protein (TIGR00725 family)
MRKLQVGIIGSCDDLSYSENAVKLISDIAILLANDGFTIVYGAEKDCNSLPTQAALAAKNNGGNTIGVTYDKGFDLFEQDAAVSIIASGLLRGGGRETVLMLSCDVVIAIAGGSGTLNEICIAYQAGIKVFVVEGYGGWSDKLANSYLYERKRYKFDVVRTLSEALNAMRIVEKECMNKNYENKYSTIKATI